MGSIKRQLLFGLLGLVLAAVGLGAWAVYRQSRAELDERAA